MDICIYIGTWSLYSIYVRTCTCEAAHFSLKKGKWVVSGVVVLFAICIGSLPFYLLVVFM